MVIKNKRGQDMSIGTLILIVLGIIVLVLLVLGFSLGWGNLWEKINIFGGSASIGDIATRCGIAVTSSNTYDYCQKFDKVKVAGQIEYVNCQDTRIESGLESKLDCGEARSSSSKSATLYCHEIGNSLGEKTVKINGFVCSSTSVASCQTLYGLSPTGQQLPGKLNEGTDKKGLSGQPLTDAIAACKALTEGGATWKEVTSGFKEAKNAASGKTVFCCLPTNYQSGGVIQVTG